MARWSPLALPDTRRAMSAAYRRAAKAIALEADTDDAADITAAVRAQADAIDDAELTWVSRDMVAVAVHAAQSLPAWKPVVAAHGRKSADDLTRRTLRRIVVISGHGTVRDQAHQGSTP